MTFPVCTGNAYFGLFETSVNTRFQIPKITEDAFFEFLHIPDGSAKSLKSEDKSADDIGACDVIEAVPEYARHVF